MLLKVAIHILINYVVADLSFPPFSFLLNNMWLATKIASGVSWLDEYESVSMTVS